MIARYPTLVPQRPFERINKMMEEMFGEATEFAGLWRPTVDIKETENELTFVCELPGVERENINVEVSDGYLTISGKRETTKEEREENFLRRERHYGEFSRGFQLDTPVNKEQIRAEFKNGLLMVHVPKVEETPKTRVPIQA